MVLAIAAAGARLNTALLHEAIDLGWADDVPTEWLHLGIVFTALLVFAGVVAGIEWARRRRP